MMKTAIPDTNPRIDLVNEAGEPQDLSILQDHGLAYDPGQATLDLTKAEKLRTTALMLAINAYQGLIIKDAEYYKAVSWVYLPDAYAGRGPVIKEATMDAMIAGAVNFEAFLLGHFSRQATIEPEKDGVAGTSE